MRVDANASIPRLEVAADRGEAELRVWVGCLPSGWDIGLQEAQIWYISAEREESGVPAMRVWRVAGGRYFRVLYSDGTEFAIERCGTEIWASWPDTLTLEDTAAYLLGPVLGMVLLLRGVICLHGSAVVVDDQAIALVGAAGAGKSTTAAAFAGLGHPVLSEDVLALDEHD